MPSSCNRLLSLHPGRPPHLCYGQTNSSTTGDYDDFWWCLARLWWHTGWSDYTNTIDPGRPPHLCHVSPTLLRLVIRITILRLVISCWLQWWLWYQITMNVMVRRYRFIWPSTVRYCFWQISLTLFQKFLMIFNIFSGENPYLAACPSPPGCLWSESSLC